MKTYISKLMRITCFWKTSSSGTLGATVIVIAHDRWIYNYLCNQCISPLKLLVRTTIMTRCTRYNIMW